MTHNEADRMVKQLIGDIPSPEFVRACIATSMYEIEILRLLLKVAEKKKTFVEELKRSPRNEQFTNGVT